MTELRDHRPEIDGLRAIGVIGVIFYHANFPILQGGFVGVDVFFVLSGFLIGRILVKSGDSLDILDFLGRRIRRIFPALVPCLSLSWLAAFLLLTSTQFADFCSSLIASALFLANGYFWWTADYFDGAAELKPLLHMWSLGVEVQFYLAYPILLALIARFRLPTLPVTIAALMSSLIYSVITVTSGQLESAFYLPHLRFWELLAGSTLALLPSIKPTPRLADMMEIAGLLLIFVPMFFYRQGFPLFPGLSALPPVLGALLVVAANDSGRWVARALRAHAIQFVGRISYSLYLWHLPLIVFSRFIWPESTSVHMAVVLLLAFPIAYTSYRVVEQPFRRMPTKRGLATGLVSATAALSTLAALIIVPVAEQYRIAAQQVIHKLLRGEPKTSALSAIDAAEVDYRNNLNKNFDGAAGAFDPVAHAGWTCSYDKRNTRKNLVDCLKSQSNQNNILVIGDSIGRDTLHALRIAYPQKNFVMLHQSGCPPIARQINNNKFCFLDMNSVISEAAKMVKFEGIVMAYRFRPSEWEVVAPGIPYLRTISNSVVWIGASPVFSKPVGEYISSSSSFPSRVSTSATDMLAWDPRQLAREAQKVAQSSGATFVNSADFFCKASECDLWDGGDTTKPLFWDNQHLTRAGMTSYAAYLRSNKTLRKAMSVESASLITSPPRRH